MKKFLFLFVLGLAAVITAPAQSQPVIIPDTLLITLEQGDFGESIDRQVLLNDPLLRALIDVTNQFPEAYLVAEYWRSPVRWVPAGHNQRHSNALDGGVNERTEMWLNGLLKEAGLLDKRKVQAIPECCTPEPQIRLSLAWHEVKPKEKPPAPAKAEPTIINNRYTTIQRIGGRLHLGIGGITSPYNGGLSLNLEAQFDKRSCLELAFGHSTGLLAQDRTVTDPFFGTNERRTYDMIYSGRYVRYLRSQPHFGIHLGILRVENTMEYNLKHIRMFQGVTIGPSVRWQNLAASASLAYGNEKFYGENTRWEFKGFGTLTLYLWR
jgi:hypothetical protein